MATTELVKLVPARTQGLTSGLAPSVEPAVGMPWYSGRNCWFKDLSLEHALGSEQIVPSQGSASRAIAQAFVNGKARLYYEDGGVVFYKEAGDSVVVGQLAVAGRPALEPFGTWLLATDGIGNLKLYKNSGTFINIASSEFARCKIIKKLSQHVLAYSTDVFPSGVHWSSASDPETWTPSETNSAGNLPFRDMDSEVIAVANLGAFHAVYSQTTMRVLRFLSTIQGFGVPTDVLYGIGAAGPEAIVSYSRYNFGICHAGIFMTDGNSFTYLDAPMLDRFLREHVDWNRPNEFVGYYDEELQLVKWTVPLVNSPSTVIGVNPETRRVFTFLSETFTAGSERSVFKAPIIGKSDGVYFTSVSGTVVGDFYIQSQLFHAGTPWQHKTWQYATILGHIADGAEIRFGFTDSNKLETLEWYAWQTLQENCPFTPRESLYMAFEIKSTAELRLSAILINGESAGRKA